MKKFSFSSKEIRKVTKKSLMKQKDGGKKGSTKLNSARSTSSTEKIFRESRDDEEEVLTEEMEDLLTLRLATPINDEASGDEMSTSDRTTHLHDEDRLESRLESMTL